MMDGENALGQIVECHLCCHCLVSFRRLEGFLPAIAMKQTDFMDNLLANYPFVWLFIKQEKGDFMACLVIYPAETIMAFCIVLCNKYNIDSF